MYIISGMRPPSIHCSLVQKNLNGSHYFSLSFLLRLPLSVSHKTTHVCALANPACPHRRVLSLNPPNNPMILCAYNPLAMLLPDLTVPRGMGGGGAHGVGRDLSRRVMEAVTSGIRQSGLIRMELQPKVERKPSISDLCGAFHLKCDHIYIYIIWPNGKLVNIYYNKQYICCLQQLLFCRNTQLF